MINQILYSCLPHQCVSPEHNSVNFLKIDPDKPVKFNANLSLSLSLSLPPKGQVAVGLWAPSFGWRWMACTLSCPKLLRRLNGGKDKGLTFFSHYETSISHTNNWLCHTNSFTAYWIHMLHMHFRFSCKLSLLLW